MNIDTILVSTMDTHGDLFDDLDDFDGTCPECGATMQRVDSGYDYEYNCNYDRYVCMEDGCDGNIHVEPDSEKILD